MNKYIKFPNTFSLNGLFFGTLPTWYSSLSLVQRWRASLRATNGTINCEIYVSMLVAPKTLEVHLECRLIYLFVHLLYSTNMSKRIYSNSITLRAKLQALNKCTALPRYCYLRKEQQPTLRHASANAKCWRRRKSSYSVFSVRVYVCGEGGFSIPLTLSIRTHKNVLVK